MMSSRKRTQGTQRNRALFVIFEIFCGHIRAVHPKDPSVSRACFSRFGPQDLWSAVRPRAALAEVAISVDFPAA
jgi:hypothetical protein